MTVQTLMEAVKAGVRECWPGEEIYTNYLPKDFKRPSFALECQKTETTDVNPFLVQRTVIVLLTCFVPVNAYGDSSRKALDQRMDALCARFAQGCFQVNDRAVRVQTDRGTSAPDFAEVTLTFAWLDKRPACKDPNASGIPKMEIFEINGAVMTGKAPEKGNGE